MTIAPAPSVSPRIVRTLTAWAIAIAVGAVWTWPYPPLQDYPDWVYQAELFSRQLGGTLPDQYRWLGLLPPNSTSTLVMGALSWLGIAPTIAGKLFLTVCLVLLPLAAQFLVGSLHANTARLLVPLAFVFGYPLLHGNINSVIGVALWAIGVGLVVRRKSAKRPLPLVRLLALSIAIFLSHGVAFLAWMLFVALGALTPSGSPRDRRTLLLASSPAVALGGLYALQRLTRGVHVSFASSDFALLEFVRYKLATLTQQLSFLPGFYPYFEPVEAFFPALVALNYAFFAVLLAVIVRSLGAGLRSTDPTVRWLAHTGVAYAFFALFAPCELGGLINPGERLIVPLLFVALAIPAPAPLPNAFAPSRSWARIAGVAALLHVAYVASYGTIVANHVARFDRALRSTVHGKTIAVVPESHLPEVRFKDRPERRKWLALPIHHPLLRLSYYTSLDRKGAAPIFATGFFEYTGRELMADDLETANAFPTYADAVAVVGDDATVERLAGRWAAKTERVARGPGYCLLVRKHAR